MPADFAAHDHDSFDQIYEQFQVAMDVSLDPVGPSMLYDLIAGLGLAAGAAVVDVGCRAGRHSIELARRFGLVVRGIDPNSGAVNIARQNLHDAARDHPGIEQRVSFALGTAQNLPAADHSTDLVWCRDVLSLVEQLGAVYAEFRRVLRPGGRALIYQMFATEGLQPAEAAWLLPVMNCVEASMRPQVTEAAITAAGLRLDQCINVSSQWAEHDQEQTGAVGRDLLHAARLLRDPDRYISQFGQGNYDIALGDCLWHIYRMIGKLSGRVYLLTAP
ncbi:MAG TPA: class I SAM-dependent methyltransferase [Streptosporangiaceae bacterium]|nr:class I SAM-dependent methyltransferase [Streptosporangiaceae bacterium]